MKMVMRGPTLNVDVLTDSAELEALSDRWNRLLDRAGAGIFQTYEWQSVWWRAFSAGRSLRAITITDDHDLVGIVPFLEEHVSIRGLRLLRRLRLIGCDQSDYLDLIVAHGYEKRVAEAVADHLCARGEWDVIELEDVPEDSLAIGPLTQALMSRGCTVRRIPLHRSFSVEIPSSLEAYVARLSHRTRRGVRRKMRILAKAGCAAETVPGGVSIDGPMEQFMALHDRGWNAKGQLGVLGDARTRMFHLEVARAFHRQGWLDLSFLKLDGKPLASTYGFIYGNRMYSYLSGIDRYSVWAKFSPGTILDVKNIERAIAMGLKQYDLLRGAERYKLRLRATETATSQFEIVAPGLCSVVRVGVHKVLRKSGSLAEMLRGKGERHFRGTETWQAPGHMVSGLRASER